MKRRIFGLENEYGLTCTLNGQRRLSPDNVARYLFEKVIPGARNANVFLENGARLYLDTGFHPEYATPECDDVAELVIHDKAGERIVEDLLHQAEKRLREDGISGNILLFKNNTDSAGNSYGCHENYLVSRDVSFQRLAEALIPFFVTRQIFAGAGKVLQTPRGFHYCLSQRAQHICQEISGSTTSSRSIINTRRAARRRRALSPPAHHRGRLEHVGSGHLSEDRDNGPGARHDRRWILRSRLFAAITCAGDTRHLPRPDVERDDHAQGRAHAHCAPDAARVPRVCDALCGLDQPRPGDEGRARPLDRRAHEARVGPDAALARARLGDQEGMDRQVYGPPPALVARPEGRAARPPVPRHPAREGRLLPAGAQRPGGPDHRRRDDRAGQARAAADDARPPARRVHPSGKPEGQGLPRGLGLPEAERPGTRDDPLQRPIPVPRRTGRAPDPLLLARAPPRLRLLAASQHKLAS